MADETNSASRAYPRSAVLAAVMSLILPGAGQVYIGEAKRGLYYMAALAAVLLASLVLMSRALGVWVIAFCMAVVFLGAFIDAIYGALRRQDYRLKPYNRWYVYLGLITIVPATNVLLSLIGVEVGASRPFSTPSASMCPTLLAGDNFIADTGYYRRHQPAHDEVALYTLKVKDGEPVVYAKRIAGLPGDRIEIRDHRLVRNGKTVDEPYIVITGQPGPFANVLKQTVPEGMLFMLGDNRSNSMDSRAPADLHGLVPVENLIARAGQIYWPSRWSRFGLELQAPYDTGGELWQQARTSCAP